MAPLKPLKITTLHGIGHSNKVEGEGIVERQLSNEDKTISFQSYALYLPSSHAQLFSPQLYFFENKDGSFHNN